MEEEIKEKLSDEFIEESLRRSFSTSLKGHTLAEVMVTILREKPPGRAVQIFSSLPEHLQKGIIAYLAEHIREISLEELCFNKN